MVLRRWYPERSPTWSDVIIPTVLLVGLSRHLIGTSPHYWEWIATGFLTGLIFLGPVANSTVGDGFGTWFQEIGGAERIATIAVFTIVVGVIIYLFGLSTTTMASFAIGAIVSFLVYLVGHIAHSGEINGWS